MTNEQIQTALSTVDVGGEHTSGGDSLLPKADRGVLDGWSPDEPVTVAEVRAVFAKWDARRRVYDQDGPPELLEAIEQAYMEKWRAFGTSRDWPTDAIEDVSFHADIPSVDV